MKCTSYKYCVCRLDKKYWKSINEKLKDRGYKNIKALVPTVKILRKSKNGKNFYDELPLLFSYGFIKMPTEKAFNRQFLIKLKKEIPGILNWLRSTESMHPKKKKKRIDNAEDFDDFSMVATISKKEYKHYKTLSRNNQIFSADDIVNLKIGDYITLRSYPFDGIGAVVNGINLVTKMVTVTIYPENGSLAIQIPIDNVLYSIYQDYDEDKLSCLSNNTMDVNSIPEGYPDEVINQKQY